MVRLGRGDVQEGADSSGILAKEPVAWAVVLNWTRVERES